MIEKALAGYLRFGPPPCFLVGGFRAKGDNALFVQNLDHEYHIMRFSEFELSSAAEWINHEGAMEVRRVGGRGLLAVLLDTGKIVSGSANELKDSLLHLEESLNKFPFFHYETLRFLEREEEAARAIREAAKLFSSQAIARSWTLRELESLRRPKLDPDKQAAVSELVKSNSFQATHAAIARLLPFLEKLDARDITQIAEAIVSNNQIHWIHEDVDVADFLSRFKISYSSYISDEILHQIEGFVRD